MELKDIRKIIELMKANELSEFELEQEAFRIAIKRSTGIDQPVYVAAPSAPSAPAPVAPAAPAAAPGAPAEPAPPPADDDAGLIQITSPMVGTFYTSSSPESPAFVKVGDTVGEDSVVCIIEAMKVMNEIKAETKGVVKKILVENGTPVEYGEALFLVEPA